MLCSVKDTVMSSAASLIFLTLMVFDTSMKAASGAADEAAHQRAEEREGGEQEQKRRHGCEAGLVWDARGRMPTDLCKGQFIGLWLAQKLPKNRGCLSDPSRLTAI